MEDATEAPPLSLEWHTAGSLLKHRDFHNPKAKNGRLSVDYKLPCTALSFLPEGLFQLLLHQEFPVYLCDKL